MMVRRYIHGSSLCGPVAMPVSCQMEILRTMAFTQMLLVCSPCGKKYVIPPPLDFPANRVKYRGGVMMQIDPSGKVVSEYRDPLAHHDQNHLDDGTLLYTTVEAMTEEEASSVVGGIPGSEAYDGKIYAD